MKLLRREEEIQGTTHALKILQARYTAPAMVAVGTPIDTLIMTLLSARARDEQVLRVYPLLRVAFPTLEALASADVRAIERCISTVGLFRAKARAVKALARTLITDHQGEVPRTMEALVALPGVGRKTASCVLGYAFHLPAIAVDTHVLRVTKRLGWAKGKTPERVEEELKQIVSKRLWIDLNRVVIQFGRDICRPGIPQCWRCPLRTACAFRTKTPAPKVLP